MQDRGGGFATGLLVGALMGMLVGLLLAPAPGEETRRLLGQRATETGDRMREGTQRIAGRVREGAGTIGGRAAGSAQAVGRRVADHVGSLVDTVQQTVGDAVRGLNADEESGPAAGEAAAAVDGPGGQG